MRASHTVKNILNEEWASKILLSKVFLREAFLREAFEPLLTFS